MIKRSALTFIFSTAMVLGIGAAAGAQECEASPQACEPGVLPAAPQALPPQTPAGPTAVAAAPVPRQTLPVTGSETAALAIGGTLLVAAGGALVWRSNKATA